TPSFGFARSGWCPAFRVRGATSRSQSPWRCRGLTILIQNADFGDVAPAALAALSELCFLPFNTYWIVRKLGPSLCRLPSTHTAHVRSEGAPLRKSGRLPGALSRLCISRR